MGDDGGAMPPAVTVPVLQGEMERVSNFRLDPDGDALRSLTDAGFVPGSFFGAAKFEMQPEGGWMIMGWLFQVRSKPG